MMKGNEKEEHFHKKKTVKVIVRVRPFLKNETSMKCVFIEGKYVIFLLIYLYTDL